MSDLNLGTQYEFSKSMVNQLPALNEGNLNSKKEIVKNFIIKENNFYYMLLCNEQKDYTIFHWNKTSNTNDAMEMARILVDECLKNRGEIRGIDLTEHHDAIEIWLYIEEDSYVYYFFPYDAAVIEV